MIMIYEFNCLDLNCKTSKWIISNNDYPMFSYLSTVD